MKELNKDQIDFLKDLIKSEGWKILITLVKSDVEIIRKLATSREELLKDERLAVWYSAEAEGMEKVVALPEKYFE